MTCEGICVAPLFDAIEAFPFVGDMVEKARNGMCDGARVSGVADGVCPAGGNYKHIREGGFVCDMLSAAFQINSNGCDLILNCMLTAIQEGGNLGHCMANIENKVVSGMKIVTENLDSMTLHPGYGHKFKKMQCPLTAVPEMVNKFKGVIDAVQNLVSVLDKAKNTIIEIAKLVLDGKCEGMQWSFLIGLGVDFQFGPMTSGEEVGVYLTMETSEIKELAQKAVFTPQGHLITASSGGAIHMAAMLLSDLFDPQSKTVIGLYSARSASVSTSIGTEASMGSSISFLAGGKDNWGGYGFEVGLELDFPGVGFGLNVGVVFSAREDNQVKRLIGITVGLGAGLSAESSAATLGTSVYVGCGLAATMALNAKDGQGQDKWEGWSTIGKEVKGGGVNMCSASKTKFKQSFSDINQILPAVPDSRKEAEKCFTAAKCIAQKCTPDQLKSCYKCKVKTKVACNKCNIKVKGKCKLEVIGIFGKIICKAWYYSLVPHQGTACLAESAVCTAWNWREEVKTGFDTCGSILKCGGAVNCAAEFVGCNARGWAPKCTEGVADCIGV